MRRACALALTLTMTAAASALAASTAYKVVDQIKGPDGNWDFVHVDTHGNRLWMTRGTTIMTLDLKTHAARAGVVNGKRLHDVMPVNGGHEILVSEGDADRVFFADPKTGHVTATVATGKNPDAMTYDRATGLVMVMAHDGGKVVLVDPKAHAKVGEIKISEGLEMAAVDGRGHAYVNVEDTNETVEVDLRAKTIVRRIPLTGCKGPTGVAYVAAKHWLLASCDGSTVTVDARSGKVVAVLKTGSEADGVAVDEKRELAFVPGREGNLSVISLKSHKPFVTQVIRTARNNRTLAVDPRNGRVYLPVAELAPPAAPGGRPTAVPGTFKVVVVGD